MTSSQQPSSRFCPPRRRRQLCHNRLYRLATGMIAHCPVGPSGTRDQIDQPPRQEEQTPPLCCVPCTGDEQSIVVIDAVVGQRIGEAVPPLPHPFQGVRERGPRQDPPFSSSLPSWMMRSWAPPASLHLLDASPPHKQASTIVRPAADSSSRQWASTVVHPAADLSSRQQASTAPPRCQLVIAPAIPPSTFSRLAAGCPAPTAPDTVDCRVNGCTLGVFLEPSASPPTRHLTYTGIAEDMGERCSCWDEERPRVTRER